MKRKNLERAVVLGLILSAGLYGNVWAADINSDSIIVENDNIVLGDENTTDNYIITATPGNSGIESTVNGKEVSIETKGGISISTGADMNSNEFGIYAKDGGSVSLTAGENGIDINTILSSGKNTSKGGIYNYGGIIELDSAGSININGTVKPNDLNETDTVYGVYNVNAKNSSTTIKSGSIVTITANGESVSGIDVQGGTLNIQSEGLKINSIRNNKASSFGDAYGFNVYNWSSKDKSQGILDINGDITFNVVNNKQISNSWGENYVYGVSVVGIGEGGSFAEIHGNNININVTNNGINEAVGIGVQNYSQSSATVRAAGDLTIDVKSKNADAAGISTSRGKVDIDSEGSTTIKAIITDNSSDAEGYAIVAGGESQHNPGDKKSDTVTITSNVNNTLKGTNYAIYSMDNSTGVNITAETGSNILEAGTKSTGDFGDKLAVNALSGSEVVLSAGNQNSISGGVYANGVGTSVTLKGLEDSASKSNYVRSYAVIDGAGDLDEDTSGKFDGKSVISALYAQAGAKIKLTGENNIGTYAIDGNPYQLERTVWAYDGSNIEFDGATTIKTDSYATSKNSDDIAIAAGTGVNLEDVSGSVDPSEISRVSINYKDYSNRGSSYIEGDILSAYKGVVDITSEKDTDNKSIAGIGIKGNLLSANNGVLNVELGKKGFLIGRIDDYQDAGTKNEDGTGHLSYYNPAFSSSILSGGNITLDMGEDSTWVVTGQSWVTTLKGDGTIDMRNDNPGDGNAASHAVHIGKLTGDHTFVMDLNDINHNISDMLYIKDEANSSGTQTVYLNSVAGLENMQDGDRLRFATVNAGTDKLKFIGEYNGENGYNGGKNRVMLYDTGFNNVNFVIGNEEYDSKDTENSGYNGESFDETKPGDAYVDNTYGDGVNWYITKDSSGDEISDGGKTMLNMSRANYSNAIYMDRLNKRIGEALYINSEEDDGLWVRLRHDRIGKDDAFRSQNTMYEVGYDKKQECDNGERRIGMAIDYMHGDTGYSDISGKGEIDRYGLWLYNTWLGDKGHYVDYVAKWGHLSNDFEVYTMTRGEKVSGDYSNNVFSISAEYGRKKDIGNDWYFEPQVQAQLARVTGADYETSQGTKVSVDGINSLIGRAGFRLGKDFGEEKQSTVYLKADVLHEFLGDQDIKAMDDTTNGWQTVSYENEGTWYDVGFGFATQLSKASYAFMDFEKSFGHDNDETYQINVGMQWSF